MTDLVLPHAVNGSALPVPDPYRAFLESKVKRAPVTGFAVADAEIHPLLKPHQRLIVRWALAGGCRAIFASFGLGKSFMQLEIGRLILAHHPGERALISMPLGVRREFMRDAEKLGIPVRFIRSDAEAEAPGLYLTNHEAVVDGRVTPARFVGILLDEASVLRSYGSKTFHAYMELCAGVRFRFVATATPNPNRLKELIHYAGFLGVMDTGQALAQPLDARVLTPTGWVIMGKIRVGDLVIAGDGTSVRVLGVHPQGEKDIYEIVFSDGARTKCTGDHLWLTRTQYERNNDVRYRRRGGSERSYWTVKETNLIADTLQCKATGGRNHEIPMVSPVRFTPSDHLVHPYVLGVLLGDGHLRETSVNFTTIDQWIVDRVERLVEHHDLIVRKVPHVRRDGRTNYDYGISCGRGKGSGGGRGHETNTILRELRRMHLLDKRAWNKSVPAEYIFSSIEDRLALLQGLMDTDGTISADGDNPRFISCSHALAKDVQALVQSLGGVATIVVREVTGQVAKFQGHTIERKRPLYVVAISLPNEFNPFALPRKAERVVPKTKYPPRRYIDRVSLVGRAEAQCISVDHPEHLYVTDDFLVTHNTRFFQRNSEKSNDLTLYPHKEREFWTWLASWAVVLQRPSDLGFSDEGYDLPPLTVRWHEVDVPGDHQVDRDGQGLLIAPEAKGLADEARARKASLDVRVAKVAEVVAAAGAGHVVVWHDLEAERHAIQRAVPEARSVWGSQDLDAREDAIMGFGDGAFRVLSTKPSIAGSGCNFQRHCHRAVFAGVGHKFNDFIQAIHRVQRFQQAHPVEIDIVHTVADRGVRRSLEDKWAQHEEMGRTMSEIIRRHGLNSDAMAEVLERSIGVERVEVQGENWRMIHNDCVEEVRRWDANAVDLIVTSIPFSNHYEYTPSYNDFGHSEGNAQFFAQMDHLTPELLRVLRPGRIAAVHVKDRVEFGNVTGTGLPTIDPFHAECIMHYRRHGFDFCGMIHINTDVVRENNGTYRLGYTEMLKDSTKMGVGCPEYVLLLHKPQSDKSKAYADVRVAKTRETYSLARWQIDAHSFWRSSGDRFLTPEEWAELPTGARGKLFTEMTARTLYDHEAIVRVGEMLEAKGALPKTFMGIAPGSTDPMTWDDVLRIATLNKDQSLGRREKHICPLQIDLVDRLIARFSNPGEEVFDPFGGLGTVPVRALHLGRRGVGTELNPGYFRDALRYLEREAARAATPTLFGALDELAGFGRPADVAA